MKLIRGLILLGAGFALGTLAGYGWAFVRVIRPVDEAMTDRALWWAGERAYVQYRFGKPETIDCVLGNHIRALQDLAAKVKGARHIRLMQSIGLFYARLGVAGGRAGRPEYQREMLKLARATANSIRDHPIDDAAYLKLVEDLDEGWDREIRDCTLAWPPGSAGRGRTPAP